MKNGRSSGYEEISAELVICAGKYLDKYLLQVINSCLEQNEMPKQ